MESKHKWPLWGLALYAHLGEREQSPGDNGAIMAFSSILKAMDIAVNDEVPWCAAAVGASLERAGVGSTRSLMAKSYLTWGTELQEPIVGAIAVFDRPPNPDEGHVTFVADWDRAGNWIDCLGGNQDNAVAIARFRLSDVRAFRWTHLAIEDRLSPTFELALKHVLGVEGGYTNDPRDKGGPTNLGITLDTLRRWRGKSVTAADVEAVSRDEATAIYVSWYWFKSWADQLPPALALMHFDCAVNQGVGAAARFLQEAVTADVDGEIGPKTLGLAQAADARETILEYAALRESHYRSLANWPTFGNGWMNRLNMTRNVALALIPETSATPKPPAIPPQVQPEKEPQPMNPDDATLQPTAPAPESKPATQSLTMLGALLTFASVVLPAALNAYGIPVTPDMVLGLGSQAATAVQALVAVTGTVLQVYGRMRATQPVTLLK